MADTTIYLQRCLDRLQAGNEAARKELINTACQRLQRLTQKMLRADDRLQRWEETDDVFQSIHGELIDLARHYYGPHGLAAKHHSEQFEKEADGTLRLRTSRPIPATTRAV